MRCFICAKWSFEIICDMCVYTHLKPQITTRRVGTLDVISFYKFSLIESLLLTKHKPEGFRIYRRLAKITLKPFIEQFVEGLQSQEKVAIIGIDEQIKGGYSHIAQLTHAMQTPQSKTPHSSLLAKNRVTYAGKSLQFRLENPRLFRYTSKSTLDAILVDDIITSGLTLQEAQQTLARHSVETLFALTLADAKL